jgi:hypothetical protein
LNVGSSASNINQATSIKQSPSRTISNEANVAERPQQLGSFFAPRPRSGFIDPKGRDAVSTLTHPY